MKKILSIILASLLAVTLVACGGGNSGGGDTSKSTAKTIEEVQTAWEGIGYEVTPIAADELGFEAGVAEKGIQVLDFDGNLIAIAYFEFASKADADKIVDSFKSQEGITVEEVNANFFKLVEEGGHISSYVAHNDKYVSLGLPFGDDNSLEALDAAYEAIGFAVK